MTANGTRSPLTVGQLIDYISRLPEDMPVRLRVIGDALPIWDVGVGIDPDNTMGLEPAFVLLRAE